MKRMRMGGERSEPGIDVATIRELKILRELHSEYVVEVLPSCLAAFLNLSFILSCFLKYLVNISEISSYI